MAAPASHFFEQLHSSQLLFDIFIFHQRHQIRFIHLIQKVNSSLFILVGPVNQDIKIVASLNGSSNKLLIASKIIHQCSVAIRCQRSAFSVLPQSHCCHWWYPAVPPEPVAPCGQKQDRKAKCQNQRQAKGGRYSGAIVIPHSCFSSVRYLSSAKLPETVPPDSMALNWSRCHTQGAHHLDDLRFSASVFWRASSALALFLVLCDLLADLCNLWSMRSICSFCHRLSLLLKISVTSSSGRSHDALIIQVITFFDRSGIAGISPPQYKHGCHRCR